VAGIWGELFRQFYLQQKRSKKRKKKLLRILNRFKESTAAMPDATVVMRERGEIEWWNDAARHLLGLKAPEDVGQRVDNLIRFPSFTEYLHEGDYTEQVIFASPVNDKIVLSGQIVPYGKSQTLLVARDVTRLQHLEKMRRDFVANVSHELKTPLTVISGFLETMTDSSGLPPRWARSIQLMHQQTARMRAIVEDLLFLSRLETSQSPINREVEVASMLNQIRDEAFALAESKNKQLDIVAELDHELPLIGDEAELRSAFSNLVVNAVKYVGDQGAIAIRWFAEGDRLVMSVTDTGEGIAQHHIPRLTERFYRVDASRSRESGGTGLGLAIVKHVLERHNARLEITSKLHEGSTFSCVFPMSRRAARQQSRIASL
jgi:two-component system phosphate regulon sensor histidine kinase PhoR